MLVADDEVEFHRGEDNGNFRRLIGRCFGKEWKWLIRYRPT